MEKTLDQIFNDAEHVAGFDGVYVSMREEDFDALTQSINILDENLVMATQLLDAAIRVVNGCVALKQEGRVPSTRGEIIMFAELDKFTRLWAKLAEETDARNSKVATDQS